MSSKGGGNDGLDALVADLIAKEARQKGSGTASPKTGPSYPRPTSSRFLNRLVRNVESHNDALRQAEPREKKRSSHAGESTEARAGKMRAWRDDDEEEEERASKRDRGKQSIGDRRDEDRRAEASSKHRKHAKRVDDSEPSSSQAADDLHATPPSKMDKYFCETYDPALDVSANVHTDAQGLVDDDGWERMLAVLKAREQERAARHEARRADKRKKREREEEQERHHRRRKNRQRDYESDKEHHRRKRSRNGENKKEKDRESERRKSKSPSPEPKKKRANGLLDTAYSKPGAAREWDRGKQVPT